MPAVFLCSGQSGAMQGRPHEHGAALGLSATRRKTKTPVPTDWRFCFSLEGAVYFRGSRPSRWARLRASLRARRTASARSRARFSDGFS